MRVRTVVRQEDSLLLEPIQEPFVGWRLRPGTVRVAEPYDSNVHSSQPTDPLPRKRQKRARTNTDNAHDHEQDLVQWIKTEFRSIIERDASQSWIRDIQDDYFYGTLVDAPACNTFALDLVKLHPTLRMLRSGFVSTNDWNTSTDQEGLTFDRIELGKGSQQLDLGDIYEVLVMNSYSEPAVITFPTEGKPRYLMPPRSGFVVSDLIRIHGLKSVGKSAHTSSN